MKKLKAKLVNETLGNYLNEEFSGGMDRKGSMRLQGRSKGLNLILVPDYRGDPEFQKGSVPLEYDEIIRMGVPGAQSSEWDEEFLQGYSDETGNVRWDEVFKQMYTPLYTVKFQLTSNLSDDEALENLQAVMDGISYEITSAMVEGMGFSLDELMKGIKKGLYHAQGGSIMDPKTGEGFRYTLSAQGSQESVSISG